MLALLKQKSVRLMAGLTLVVILSSFTLATVVPFWGWGDWSCGECDATYHKSCTRTYYVLWIPADHDYSYVQCDAE
jgi:hypothetical protein